MNLGAESYPGIIKCHNKDLDFKGKSMDCGERQRIFLYVIREVAHDDRMLGAWTWSGSSGLTQT